MNYLFLQAKQFHNNLKLFSGACQFISHYGTLVTSARDSLKAKHRNLGKVLNILDFVNPKINKDTREDCHQRLIQICMHDFLDADHQQCSAAVSNYMKDAEIPDFSSTEVYLEEDSLSQFDALLKRGINLEATTFSSIISSCGATGNFSSLLQLHAFSIKVCLDVYVSVGSKLICFYSKFGNLDESYKVFHHMPLKNVVTCTAIISVYAQHGQLETCLHLFNLMRHSNLKPNDFTYASLLSVCTNCASLSLGRTFHCLQVRVGYVSCTHVSNALISMYSKCGVLEEASYVFMNLQSKNLISWNAMIFGYAHYGIANQALNLFKEMVMGYTLPDRITFLGILSACRHAGLVNEGRYYFDLMWEHGIQPELDHCSCIVDLLGRTGLLEEAVGFIEEMPVTPNAVIWGSLLTSCRVHGNVRIGIHAAKKRLLLEPGCAATHVQLANLYASIESWNDVADTRKLMKEKGLKTTPGCSWIEIGNRVYQFKADDGTNKKLNDIIATLDNLGEHMYHLNLELWNSNNYKGKGSFIEFAIKAKRAGRTDPEPREDLFGTDVSRGSLWFSYINL